MGTDKIKHIVCGVIAAVAVGLPAYLQNVDLFAGLWSAITSGILLAGCKEFCDMRTEGNKWDWLDFGCTVIGAVVVALFIVGLHYGKG